MESLRELLLAGKSEEVWRRCCGFYDLDIEQFMTIQKQLLMEQIELLSRCELGQKLLKGATPRSVDEFREKVPLTVYNDYTPYLPDKMEDALPEKPVTWQHTSGRSEEFSYKWVPISSGMYKELGDVMMAVFLVGSCKGKGEVTLNGSDKMLYGLAPPPYASGAWMRRLNEEKVFKFLPPVDEAEKMEFQERIEIGFQMAMLEGLDVMGAIASILVAIGERFGQGGGAKRIGTVLKHPQQLPRLIKAVIKAKIARRSLLPRDIWTLKGVLCSGTDAFVYREKLKQMWGKYPLDVYGATECQVIAAQAWNYKDMTFVPYLNLWEFIPLPEYTRWQQNNKYQPRTLLLDEVMPGERYAIAGTNFRGGAYTRYVLGDVIEITGLHDSETGIRLPQMSFYGRADGNIDFEGLSHAYFTEKLVWQGIANSGVSYTDWVARKEMENGKPMLGIYIELKDGDVLTDERLTSAIHDEFKKLITGYVDLENALGFRPVRVKIIPTDSFSRYMAHRRATGSDLAHIKPPHMNPTDSIMSALLGDMFTAEAARTVENRRVSQP